MATRFTDLASLQVNDCVDNSKTKSNDYGSQIMDLQLEKSEVQGKGKRVFS